MNDFQVYHRAAQRLAMGENLYRPVEDGHYYYKYSPTAAVFFLPLGLLPVIPAQVVYWLFLALVICLGFYISMSLVKPGFRDENPRAVNNILLLACLTLVVHFQRELRLGQANALLMVMFFVLFYLESKGKLIAPALVLAASVFIKPYALIFLPYFALKKKLRLIGLSCLLAAVFYLLPAIFIGFGALGEQQGRWLHELALEMSSKQNMLSDGNHTSFSVVARSIKKRLIEFTHETTLIYQAALVILLMAAFLYLLRRGRAVASPYALEWALLLLAIPLLSATSRNAFVFAQLAVLAVLFNFGRLAIWQKVVAVSGLVLLGGNMYDLWGPQLFKFLDQLSLVAVGAILIAVTLGILRSRRVA